MKALYLARIDATSQETVRIGVLNTGRISIRDLRSTPCGGSAGRSSLDALLFFEQVLKRCRGRPVIKTDRGSWYNWPGAELDCDHEHETWGDRSLVEAWFGLVKYRTVLFWHRLPHRSSIHSTDEWIKAFATIHNAIL